MNNQTSKNPIILVHGIFDTQSIFNRMNAYLTRLGWEVHTLNLVPNDGRLGLEVLAKQVSDYVAKTFPHEQPIDVVGFSMGGIVSRYYVQRLNGVERVQRLVTISSPHNGTLTGFLYPTLAASQMRPNSSFLQDLNQDLTPLERLNFTSIWTPFDGMIVPAKSSQISVGEELTVNVLVHAWMVTDIKALDVVAKTLNNPLKPSTSRYSTVLR